MFHWEDLCCKQTAYENHLRCSIKTQDLNVFTFAIRFTHKSVQGSSVLKHVHCPVRSCSGLLAHLINSHKAVTTSGRSAHYHTYLPLARFYSYYSGDINYC